MKDKIYNKISTEINPEFAGWYDTDKGELFWFQQEKVWSPFALACDCPPKTITSTTAGTY